LPEPRAPRSVSGQRRTLCTPSGSYGASHAPAGVTLRTELSPWI
jgi:hypothetical protein